MNIIDDMEACLAAAKSRDARFDGRIFVGVTSTMIYCRPICRTKPPKDENCVFFLSQASAETAGFRPCLRCRPELAPGFSSFEKHSLLAERAAQLINYDLLTDRTLLELANELDVSDRHLRRSFKKVYGVTPVKYLQSARLLMAKRLLTDSALSVTDIAFACGFHSLRRFNELFLNSYRFSPTKLRTNRSARVNRVLSDSIRLTLDYRPPYLWDELINFISLRTISGVESVEAGEYRRVVSVEKLGVKYTGYFTVKFGAKLIVNVSCGLLPVLSTVLSGVKQLFDTDCEPAQIYSKLAFLEGFRAGLRVPGAFYGFETAVRAILGQQITVKAANTIATRLVKEFGEKVSTPYSELTHTFPTPKKLSDDGITDKLGALGIISSRGRSICELAKAYCEGKITLSRYSDPTNEIAVLKELPGIGEWTAQYIAMRVLGWPDAFLHTDLGIIKALGNVSAKDAMLISEKMSPWKSYGVIYLWSTL
jgi:AraC family transcriptional regulator of adaptative response / DNA-3-methyladenine glycosylase II